MSEEPYPISLNRTSDGGLLIDWSDGQSQTIRVAVLRAACPCATCRERRGQDTPSDIAMGGDSHRQPVKIVSMIPAGSYAYHIHFSDGHSSGIYSFEILRALNDRHRR